MFIKGHRPVPTDCSEDEAKKIEVNGSKLWNELPVLIKTDSTVEACKTNFYSVAFDLSMRVVWSSDGLFLFHNCL